MLILTVTFGRLRIVRLLMVLMMMVLRLVVQRVVTAFLRKMNVLPLLLLVLRNVSVSSRRSWQGGVALFIPLNGFFHLIAGPLTR